MSYANHREHVIALIEEGNATRKSICEEIGFKPASLASVFTQLRLMGKYPMTDEDGILRFGTADEYAEAQANRGAGKAAKTPEEKLESAKKMLARNEKLAAKLESKDGELANLKLAVAVANVALYTYLVEALENGETEVDAE